MAAPVRPLKDVTNVALLDAVRRDASTDYQRRIPLATQSGVQSVLGGLTTYRPAWNEFLDALINRIGSVVARNISWQNPLAEFKRGMLEYGDTIEEIQVGLLTAHTYDPDREYMEKDIFGQEVPDVESNFHKVNRQNFYKISVNEDLLKRAFLDGNGLSTFVGQLLEAPSTSDQWDEFLLTTRLFAEYEAQGGFYHVNVPDVRDIASGADDAKVALRKMRAMADTLKFVSTKYNTAHMPTFARPDELVLFVTPEFNAAIDVEALAAAFNVDRTKMPSRVVVVPQEHFNIEGCQAVMTVTDFFVIADQLLENTSQPNPVGLHQNYFLHHWQVVSASRFVPAVMFWTGADDEVVQVSTPVTGIATLNVQDKEGDTVTSVTRGALYAVVPEGAAVPEDADTTAVLWSVSGHQSNKTFITNTGVLHVGSDEPSESVKVTARSVWIDPENTNAPRFTGDVTVSVVGADYPDWPDIDAETAVAGTPGEFTPEGADVPVDLDALAGLTASPATAWTTGQYVKLADGSQAHWDGDSWEAGAA